MPKDIAIAEAKRSKKENARRDAQKNKNREMRALPLCILCNNYITSSRMDTIPHSDEPPADMQSTASDMDPAATLTPLRTEGLPTDHPHYRAFVG